jgi:hypothetical protein
MQITARKQRFSPVNLKYVAVTLGIVAVLAASVTTYTITRDDSAASQPVAVEPTLKSHYVAQAGEGMLSGNGAVAAHPARVQPTLREGFLGQTGEAVAPTIPSVTTRDDFATYAPYGGKEGFIDGSDGSGLSYLAPAVRSYADVRFLEQNGLYDLGQTQRADGLLDEEFTQPNPGHPR